jgi:hypothetical protein
VAFETTAGAFRFHSSCSKTHSEVPGSRRWDRLAADFSILLGSNSVSHCNTACYTIRMAFPKSAIPLIGVILFIALGAFAIHLLAARSADASPALTKTYDAGR